ncbi:MAG: hypothetical protein JRN20_00110 [Nitrososphaerota archaeon]|nr:hypothetical protein [Nitrososphaerota archaeon]
MKAEKHKASTLVSEHDLEEEEQRLSSIVQDYFHLMKPGIVTLLVFEAITAMIVATGRSVSVIALGLLALVGILASGGASALDEYLEREREIKMPRRQTGGRLLTNESLHEEHLYSGQL